MSDTEFIEFVNNADFHAEGWAEGRDKIGDHPKGALNFGAGWGETEANRDQFFIDGQTLVARGKYLENAEEALRSGDYPDCVSAMRLLNIAKATDPNNPKIYDLLNKTYDAIRA